MYRNIENGSDVFSIVKIALEQLPKDIRRPNINIIEDGKIDLIWRLKCGNFWVTVDDKSMKIQTLFDNCLCMDMPLYGNTIEERAISLEKELYKFLN